MLKNIKYLIIALVALLPVSLCAQNVEWSSRVERIDSDNYTIIFTASIPDGYHMYDMGPYELGGPNATTFSFDEAQGGAISGAVEPLTAPHVKMDKTFGMEIGTFDGDVDFEVAFVREGDGASSVSGVVEWMICNDVSCMAPSDWEFEVSFDEYGTMPIVEQEVEAAEPVAPVEESDNSSSMWAIIIEAVLWGLAALLTPCVFPMVPMTVSFFIKGSGGVARGRLRAMIYGLFIVALYTLPIAAIILITKFVGGDAVTADIFNWLATHWLPNLLFFVVFMIFAASFFGAFEITMPSSMVNKTDSKADSKGLGGIFFMALTLVLVSFSCTGPIVSSVLIKSTSGEFWNPIITMLAFSAAFALPFTLLAFFPSMMSKMPKSGGWLNSVKVVLGFVEVALGFKFLSVADQTYHWGLLDREVYLAIWIVVFSLMGLYLLGKLRFAHDSEVKHITVGRLALAIGVFTFVVYLIPGMFGAPLKGLSGYLPPLHTQDFVLGGEGVAAVPVSKLSEKPKYSDFLHLPHNLEGFFDLDEAEAYAAKVNKPLFIDFTGHGCVNCREMEAKVWSDPQVLQLLRDEYVIVALYSDDKTSLPEGEWLTTPSGKVLKSLGKKNAHIAITRYGANAQPYYLLQNTDGTLLNTPRGYDTDAVAFADFLRDGVAKFNQ